MVRQDRSTAEVAVIVLSVNQQDKTLLCLSHLLATKETPFRVILWDNGSTDGTAEAVREAFPEVIVHSHPMNIGVASGRNAAAALAIDVLTPSYLLFLDNDITIEPGFVDALLQPFAYDPKLGQTQAKLRFMHDRQRLNDGGGAKITFWLGLTVPVGYREVDRGQRDKPRRCVSCGGAMMVRTAVFQQLGGFDATFDPFGPEDLDFSLRLAKADYYALYVPDAVAYHAVGHSYGRGYTEEYARDKLRFFLLLLRRHASVPEKLGFLLVGMPYLAVRVILREGRRGNLRALRGLVRGMIDSFRPSYRQGG